MLRKLTLAVLSLAFCASSAMAAGSSMHHDKSHHGIHHKHHKHHTKKHHKKHVGKVHKTCTSGIGGVYCV